MTAVLAAARALHLMALAGCLGAGTFLVLVARPALAGHARRDDRRGEALEDALLHASAWALALALATALAGLGAQATLLTGSLSWSVVERLVFRTQAGQLTLVRIAVMVVLGMIVLVARAPRAPSRRFAARLALIVLGGAALILLAGAGHAAATEPRWRAIHLVADALHLASTGVWLGGLPALALLLARPDRELRGEDPVLADATRRFSRVALVSVVVLVLTGAVNTWILVGDLPSLIGTPYGRWLMLKLALLGGVLSVAAVNLLRVAPAMAQRRAGGAALVKSLRRNVGLELVGGCLIVIVVGVLGTTPPARHTEPWWPLPVRFSWDAMKDVPGVRTIVTASAIMGILAASMLIHAAVSPRHRRWMIGLAIPVVLAAAVMPIPALSVDAYPTTFVRTPVAYTTSSISRGAHLFQAQCAVCHGAGGEGDGPAARALPRRPADLTAPHTAAHTAGDMYWWLTHGIKGTPMPAFEAQLSPRDRWDVINFMRALSAGEAARELAPVPDVPPSVVAPDFVFEGPDGRSETLKEQRGRAIVLLVLFDRSLSSLRLGELDAVTARLAGLGARVVAVPVDDAVGRGDVAEAYGLFRWTLAPKRPRPLTHVEFLIDRQGYLRARSLPEDDARWSDPERLVEDIQWLAKEPPRAAAPDDHVH